MAKFLYGTSMVLCLLGFGWVFMLGTIEWQMPGNGMPIVYAGGFCLTFLVLGFVAACRLAEVED